jgi:hypothetical protein
MTKRNKIGHSKMTWILWLDDVRVPYFWIGEKKVIAPALKDYEHTSLPTGLENLHWATSTEEAKELTEGRGPPGFMYLDHDLGQVDTSMIYLKWLATFHFENIPDYYIISANPIGAKNIRAFMKSWKKSI